MGSPASTGATVVSAVPAGTPSSASSAAPSVGRSAGSFSSAAIAVDSSAAGPSGRTSLIGGGGAVWWSMISCIGSVDSNGSRPVSIRYSITPNE